MNTNKLFNEIHKLYQQLGRGILNTLRSKQYESLVNDIKIATQQLDDYNPSLGNRLFWILHKQKSFPICKTCNNEIHKLNNLNDVKLHQYCSAKCAANSNETKNKRKNTCFHKYGTEFSTQSAVVKDKTKTTCMKKYGVKNVFASDKIKKQIFDTKLKRYRNGKYLNRDKSKQTCLDKYGVENVFASSEIKDKIRKTKIRKYGVDHHMKVKTIADKVQNKSKFTTLSQTYSNFILNNEYSIPLFSLDEFISNFSSAYEYKFKCKKCNHDFFATCYDRRLHRCPKCYPLNAHSYAEDEIYNFIVNDCHINALHGKGCRSIIRPYELDIYVPSKKLAIEFDGLYWHCTEQGKNRNYHLNKTLACNENGINLIHIFEDEWIQHKDIVLSRLKNILGIHENTIYARKCTIEEIDSATSIKFQNDNHIQGSVNAKVNIGLFYNDVLVSLMTFEKPRFNKKYEWELIRFCNKCNYHIPGSAGKMLKYFENTYKPKSLLSYADRRWSQGKVYETLGFKLDHISSPNYWYFKSSDFRESRIKYQKHKLKTLLDKFNPELSETDNMLLNGFHKIYDCGNLVYVKEY